MNQRITREEATRQATEMRQQGLTFDKIADHLRSVGYVSERTKQPLKEMAIRYMVTKELANEKRRNKARERKELRDERPIVGASKKLQDILTLLKVNSLSEETRIKLALAMGDEGNGNGEKSVQATRQEASPS